MSLAGEALERLRAAAASGELDRLCEGHGVTLLVAFGSAAYPEQSRARDLDIAVAFERGGKTDVLDFIHDLARAYGPVDIDLMDLAHAGPVARKQALVGCEPLYERERGAFARAQIAAILEHMDTAWLRRLDLERLAT